VSARLFVALDLPADVRASLGAFGRAAAGADQALRAVAEDDLHATLLFLGHRALDEVDLAAEAVRDAASGVVAPALELGTPRWLSPRRPHVLSVELEDRGGALAALQAAVQVALVDALGLVPDDRRYLPHVTVARVRRGAPPRRDLPAVTGWVGSDPAAFAGEAVTLYRSHLGRGPARYEPLGRVPLVTPA
jgi:RNA 2',3'-cyclic 3'-phosphodiesterase